ncbi:MAG: hypothetical protein K2M56_00955 [Muribaculaceae bacterium]|nr:hypothetical protein [Muribaculaceae bacterium]
MSNITFRRKITTQSVLAFILIIFGMALVMLAILMPPRGEIHPSVITVFGMILVAAGSFLGIDLNFQFKSYLNSLQSSGGNTQGGHRTTHSMTSDMAESNPNPDENN